MFYVLCLVVAAIGVALYLLVIFRAVPGAVEERLGALQLPEGVGVWRKDFDSEDGRRALADGMEREERFWVDEGGWTGTKLFRQVRYRAVATHEIVRVEPDVRVRLERVKR